MHGLYILTFSFDFDTFITMKKSFFQIVKEYGAMTLAAVLIAIYMHVFILPNKFVPGGVSGIAAILEFCGILDAKYGFYVLNLPLLVLALIFLNKDFSFKTVYSATIATLFMMLFDAIKLPVFTSDKLICMFLSGILGGISLKLAFAVGGSNGGTEIIARLVMKKNPDADPGNLLFIFNLFIMGVGGFFTGTGVVYDFWIVVYSLALSYVSSATYRILSRGFDPAQKFVIITEKGEEMSKSILEHLKRGVSMTLVKGITPQYEDFQPKSMLMVVVQERQVPALKKWIKEIDPGSFSFTMRVDDVITRPGFNKKYRWK